MLITQTWKVTENVQNGWYEPLRSPPSETKCRITQTVPYDSPGIVVFRRQRYQRNYNSLNFDSSISHLQNALQPVFPGYIMLLLKVIRYSTIARVHTISYKPSIVTIYLSCTRCTASERQRDVGLLVKMVYFNLPHLYLAPMLGIKLLQFR